MSKMHVLSVKLSSARDISGYAVLQKICKVNLSKGYDVSYHVPILECFPEGIEFTDICNKLVKIREAKEMAESSLVIDATEIGNPVRDIVHHKRLYPFWVSIHDGSDVMLEQSGPKIPRRDISDSLTLAMQGKKLLIAEEVVGADLFRQQIQNYQGVPVSGVREELVIAVGIAMWFANHYMGAWDPDERHHEERTSKKGDWMGM